VAEFDPKIGEFVRISGFGMTLNACRNEKLAALTKRIKRPDGSDCLLRDCQFRFDCPNLCL
jgi:hypothetical protein